MLDTTARPVLLGVNGKPITSAKSTIPHRPRNSGYSYSNANTQKPSMKGWNWRGGGPDDDLVANLPVLRQMSRQLEYDSSIVDGLFSTRTTLSIGKGLTPEPTPDVEYLGWSSEQAQKFKAQALRFFEAWAETPRNCDARGHDNFYELTRIASRSQDVNGDAFALLPRITRPHSIGDLKISLVEGDCVDNPDDSSALAQHNLGIDTFGGISESPGGEVLGVWFCTEHPLAIRHRNRLPNLERKRWHFVPLYCSETGEPLILHLMDTKRIRQRRGIPVIASSIEILLLMDKFVHAYATKAEIQALFTAIITSERPDAAMVELESLMSAEEANELASGYSDSLLALGSGIVQAANPGDKITAIESTAPSSDFGAYIGAGLEMIGPSVGVSKGFLTHTFPNSFSAARAETGLTWESMLQKRAGIITDFCQPTYEAILAEGVATGYVDAPGFFDNYITRRAYTNCRWRGPGMPQIEPRQSLAAYKEGMAIGIITGSEAASEYSGSDFYENVAARGREIQAATNAGLMTPVPAGQGTAAAKEVVAESSDDKNDETNEEVAQE